MSETECLALNVWTPGLDDAARPVMVWIHGGAFLTGSGSMPWYDGSRFAANHDVVVVTLNYRLGSLGFLHLADHPGSGNAGILDQLAALRWVRDNIAAFGGDPTTVTVFGESAGAMSVGTLLGAPASEGLFCRAILQSGAASHVHSAEAAMRMAERVRQSAGTDRLRSVPIGELLVAQASVGIGGTGRLPFQPVIDGHTLPEAPLDGMSHGASGAVELMVGTTADEMRLFTVLDPTVASLDIEGVRQRLVDSTGFAAARAAAMVELYARVRPATSPPELWAALASDMVFRVPAHRMLMAAHAGAPARRTWQYLFRWPTAAFGGRLGSCHALELPFVFDNLDAAGVEFFTGTGAERQGIADHMHASWAAFARTGNPNGDSSEGRTWTPWTPVTRTTMVFDAAPEVVERPGDQELQSWFDS